MTAILPAAARRTTRFKRVLQAISARWPLWLTRVEGQSMNPTLRYGQLVPTWAVRRNNNVRRGDLVVVDSGELGRRIVKRVTGFPYEHIAIVKGRMFVDGRVLDEPYAAPSDFKGASR